jgi:Tol biopolymer transport system component
VFSPDGKAIALRMTKIAGYDDDRERIAIYDLATRKLRVVTEGWDRSPAALVWSADGKTIFADADNLGNHSIFAIDVVTGAARTVLDKGDNRAPRVAGDRLVFVRDTLKSPPELFSAKPDGSEVQQLTHFNDARVKATAWGTTSSSRSRAPRAMRCTATRSSRRGTPAARYRWC